MDSVEFQTQAKRFTDMLTAAIMTGRLIGYDGKLHGVDVIVLGYQQETPDGRLDAKPLAICMTDEVFDLLEVRADKVRDSRG